MSVDRGFTWMDDETLSLIEIFSTEEIQNELNGSKRNIGIYERIATELSAFGFKRSAYQCREKIKRLRKEYHQAKYCFENNITPKKPMKYFELVGKLFNQDSSGHMNNTDANSDNEEEIHFTFNIEQESDASNSCTMKESLSINDLSSPVHDGDTQSSVNFEEKTQDSLLNSQHNSEDTLLNGGTSYDLSEKDEIESPWVPNVVLVENEAEKVGIRNESEAQSDIEFNEEETLEGFDDSPNEQFMKDSEEPPHKRRRKESAPQWFKKMLDNVTDTFLTYQESAESRFLDRITHIEKERMKRDENMQKLWLEFEERRRKEEQRHELKMLSLLGQFVKEINGAETKDTK